MRLNKKEAENREEKIRRGVGLYLQLSLPNLGGRREARSSISSLSLLEGPYFNS
jgi:hypothetical protein